MAKRGESKYDPVIPGVIKLLTESSVPMFVSEISRELGIVRHCVNPIMNVLRQRATPGLMGKRYKGGYGFAIGDKFPKPTKSSRGRPSIFIPEDMYRGWYNPATGLTGSKLGV